MSAFCKLAIFAQRLAAGNIGKAKTKSLTMKKKIINDPVHGFITIASEELLAVVNHPIMQRLRRIKQLGLTEMVYPGALHTRFHHALGAMHLMGMAMDTIAERGTEISPQERTAAQLAILLHDVGHGPFSHTLEHSILAGANHEEVGHFLMHELAQEIGGSMPLALQMFANTYERRFFHQLISSQLDCDRLDYLKRDCFFTGVLEGAVGAGRLIKMLDVARDSIVVESKGIYSVENFLNSRRLMYWQVYLHKTTVCAEEMLIRLFLRARMLLAAGEHLPTPEWLGFFFQQAITMADFRANPEVASRFLLLDDSDVWTCVKLWLNHPDPVLSYLASALWNRQLFRVSLASSAPSPEEIEQIGKQLKAKHDISDGDLPFFLITGTVSNAAYLATATPIQILQRNGQIQEITQATDLPYIAALAQTVTKHYVCLPR